jgi:hypothetical protein
MKEKTKTKSISEAERGLIITDYNAGMKKSAIKRKYNIADWQLVSILREEITKNPKPVIAHPKHFKYKD